MADGTSIEWTDATVNAVNGCSVVSPGCTNCYAMRSGGRNLPNHPSTGLTEPSKAGHVWTGEVRLNEAALLQPLRWRRPRRIFWNAHGDLFHPAVPDAWIDRVFAGCALTPQHQHQILTKRSARMRAYLNAIASRHFGDVLDNLLRNERDPRGGWPAGGFVIGDDYRPEALRWPLPNMWLGVSVEDQARADERIPDLLATPAAVRFLSCEPLLGPVDLHEYLLGFSAGHPADCACGHGHGFDRCRNYGSVAPHCHRCGCREFRKAAGANGLHQVIVGGESGRGARPMHPDWARSLRDQCAAAGVPFFFKQNGEFAPGEIAGDYLDPERPAKGLSYFDDRWHECWSEPDGHCDDEPDVYRVGKKRAGRLLDGVRHDGMPA